MSFRNITENFNEELNNFIKELKLWRPLIRILVMSHKDFTKFWDKFSKLHEEKKIYSHEVRDRMKKTLEKLRASEDNCQNLSEKELKELLGFSASQSYILD